MKDAAAFAMSGSSHLRPDPTCRECHNARRRTQWGPRKVTHRSDGVWLVAKTCWRCDALLTGDRFRTQPKQVCNLCRTCEWRDNREKHLDTARRISRRSMKRWNDESADTAHRRGTQWTGPEFEIAARRDLTAREAAAMLGRTVHAVRHARQLLKEPRGQYMAGVTQHRQGQS